MRMAVGKFLVLCAAVVLAWGGDEAQAAEFTTETLSANQLKQITNSKTPSFIEFFAPWCGHCQRLAPIWKDLRTAYAKNPNIVIGQVDCTTDREACSEHGISGYPTIKFFQGNGQRGMSYTGGRSLEALSTYLNEMLVEVDLQAQTAERAAEAPFDSTKLVRNQGLVIADPAALKYLLARPGWVFVKFFTPWCADCADMAPAWKELARTVGPDHGFNIVELNCEAHPEACETLGVAGFPTLRLYHDGVTVETYSEPDYSVPALVAFLSRHAGLKTPEIDMSKTVGDFKQRLPKSAEGVPTLTPETFARATKFGFAFIKAFAPWCGHCQHLAPTWGELATRFKDTEQVLVAEVDCTQHPTLCEEQGVGGYPTLMMFKNGKKTGDYRGRRDKESLVNYVKEQVLSIIHSHSEL